MKKLVSLALALLMLVGMIPLASAETAYTQAPYLDGMDLPPVAERLPKEPMVENAPYLTIGTYGGELKRAADGGNWYNGKPIEEGLFRFTTAGTVEPNVAKGFSVSEDAKVYTIYLREGMKWSDGAPFTAEDCVWFYNAICKNKVDSKGIRSCHKAKDAEGNEYEAKVEKVDDYTFTVSFDYPKYDFVEALSVDLKWHYAPKHIFEKFVQAVIDGNTETALAEAKAICGKEFADTKTAGKEMLYYFWNYPGIPTLNPYVLSTEEGKNNVKGQYYEYVRNPYYWKVDAAGQQLPYIDKIVGVTVANADQKLMLLLDGTVDFDTVGMDAIPTIQESETAINIIEWAGADWADIRSQLHFNLNVADANLNALFNNKDFRQAMSICVDRTEFAALLTDGWQEGGQAAPQPGQLGYTEEWANQWTEYDVAKAKTLFEAAGLVMGADGKYNFADGTDFVLNIKCVADTAEETYKILKPYYDAVGIESTIKGLDRSVIDNDLMSNSIEAMLYPVTGIGDISIILKPNSMVPGCATNVAWYGSMKKENATGDLLKLVQLYDKLAATADTAERTKIAEEMLALHAANQWTIGYVKPDYLYVAVNARIQNFLEDGVWSDIYRDFGIAHCQCWYIAE